MSFRYRQALPNQLFYALGAPSSIPSSTNTYVQGWQSEEEDTYFQNQRQRADNANAKTKIGFFRLMRTIGLELDDATSAFTLPGDGNSRSAILELCMAPGGFSSAALYRNSSALLRGISLPSHKAAMRYS